MGLGQTKGSTYVATAAREQRSASATEPNRYQVRKGDTLATIARRVYGSGSPEAYQRIYEANKERFALLAEHGPDYIQAGWELLIPPPPDEADPPAQAAEPLSAPFATDGVDVQATQQQRAISQVGGNEEQIRLADQPAQKPGELPRKSGLLNSLGAIQQMHKQGEVKAAKEEATSGDPATPALANTDVDTSVQTPPLPPAEPSPAERKEITAKAQIVMQQTIDKLGTNEAVLQGTLEWAYQNGQLEQLNAKVARALNERGKRFDEHTELGALHYIIDEELSGSQRQRAQDALTHGADQYSASDAAYRIEGMAQFFDDLGDMAREHPWLTAGGVAVGAAATVLLPAAVAIAGVIGTGVAGAKVAYNEVKAATADNKQERAVHLMHSGKGISELGLFTTSIARDVKTIKNAVQGAQGLKRLATIHSTAGLKRALSSAKRIINSSGDPNNDALSLGARVSNYAQRAKKAVVEHHAEAKAAHKQLQLDRAARKYATLEAQQAKKQAALQAKAAKHQAARAAKAAKSRAVQSSSSAKFDSGEPANKVASSGRVRHAPMTEEGVSSRQGLEVMLDRAYAQRGNSDAYEIYMNGVHPNRLQQSETQYLDDIAAIAKSRPKGAHSNIQDPIWSEHENAISDLLLRRKQGGLTADDSNAMLETFYRFEPVGGRKAEVKYRVYLNAKADHANQVMGHVVGDLMDGKQSVDGIELAKISGPRALQGRADSIVVYTRDKKSAEQVIGAMQRYQQQHPDHFMQDVPLMTDRRLDGVALGAEPPTSMGAQSFGGLRSGIIDDVFRQARRQGLSRQQFGELVRQRFRAQGLDPDSPHLNLVE